jgi:uncharacterized membrane protein YfcA
VPILPLFFIVFLAFVAEASVGFGSTVITVALGALWVPVDTLLPAFVPLNLLMSIYLVARYRAHIVWSVVAARVLPLMLVGMPVGMLAFRRLDRGVLVLAFGAFVVLLSTAQLVSLARRRPAAARPLAPAAGGALLVLAGIIHGAFATGGPLVVYVMGRQIAEKAAFRASLSLLWLALNLVLVVSYVASGQLAEPTLIMAAWLLVPLGAGLVVGEWVHHRIPEARFRVAMFVLLLLAGVVLMARA